MTPGTKTVPVPYVPTGVPIPLTREAALDLAQRNNELVIQNRDLRVDNGALRAELSAAKAIASWLLVILLAFVMGAVLFTTNPGTRQAAPAAGHVTQERPTQGGTQR